MNDDWPIYKECSMLCKDCGKRWILKFSSNGFNKICPACKGQNTKEINNVSSF